MQHSKNFILQRLENIKNRPQMNGNPENVVYVSKFLIHIFLRLHNERDWSISQTESWCMEHSPENELINEMNLSKVSSIDDTLFTLLSDMMSIVWTAVCKQNDCDKYIKYEIDEIFQSIEIFKSFSDPKSFELALYNLFLTCNQNKSSDIRTIYINNLKLNQDKLSQFKSYRTYYENTESFSTMRTEQSYTYSQEVIENFISSLP